MEQHQQVFNEYYSRHFLNEIHGSATIICTLSSLELYYDRTYYSGAIVISDCAKAIHLDFPMDYAEGNALTKTATSHSIRKLDLLISELTQFRAEFIRRSEIYAELSKDARIKIEE